MLGSSKVKPKVSVDKDGNINVLIKPEPGEAGIGIKKLEILEGNLIATYTDDNVENLGRVKGENGQPGGTPTVDIPSIVKEVIDQVKIPEVTIPPIPTVEEIAKHIIDKKLVKDGETPKVNHNLIIDEVLKNIELPKAPSIKDIVEMLLTKIEIPEAEVDYPKIVNEVITELEKKIKIPEAPTAEEVAKEVIASGKIKAKDGEPGKDSPLAELLTVESSKKNILGDHQEILIKTTLSEGFNTITIETTAQAADFSALYASKELLLIVCKDGQAKLIESKPLYNTFTNNSKIQVLKSVSENQLIVSANGAEVETTWKTVVFKQG